LVRKRNGIFLLMRRLKNSWLRGSARSPVDHPVHVDQEATTHHSGIANFLE